MNEEPAIEQGAAGAPEGAFTEPNADEIAELYKATGVKAAVPTGKTKGRPKAANVRAEDDDADGDRDSKTGKQGNVNRKDKSKDASDSDEDGDSGNDTDAKGAKVGKDSSKVSDESEEADSGIRGDKSAAKGDSERGSEEDSDDGADRTGRAEEQSSDEAEEGEGEEEGKRPGKSNPKVEQRFQKLTSEVKERDQLIADLQAKLQQSTQAQEQSKIAQEDPEYTIEDFRKVQDNEGNVVELNPEQAELAWRRWKDGYDGRAEQRNAEVNRQQALEKAQEEHSEQVMRDSVEAYETLESLMGDFPELVSDSGKFDADFAAKAMPIVNAAIQYQPGTEPGNEEGAQPVISGLKLNPKMILEAMKEIQTAKRSLPLNGVNDNVEVRSNVSVPHSRSSDPTVNAANELYKELKINKRL